MGPRLGLWPKYLAYALAFRGHLREAFAVNERLLRQPSASPFSRCFDPFLDLSLLGIVPDSLARATFGRALESDAGWGSLCAPPRHLRGLPWWLSRGDTAALARFGCPGGSHGAGTRRPARGPAGSAVRGDECCLPRSGAGRFSGGDPEAERDPRHALPGGQLADNCFHLNLTLARLLAARGEDRRAGELLDRWRWSGGSTPSFVLATLELGRIAERLGDTRKAAECYRFVVATWRRPDPELLPYVAEAREGLARLGWSEAGGWPHKAVVPISASSRTMRRLSSTGQLPTCWTGSRSPTSSVPTATVNS